MQAIVFRNRCHFNRVAKFPLKLLTVAICLSIALESAFAQAPNAMRRSGDPSATRGSAAKTKTAKTTTIEFELLQASDAAGLHAQQWLKVLEPLDVSLRIHRATKDDKPDVTEREVAGVRRVTAIGTLDRSGKITFPNRSFTLGDAAKLKEWVGELRTYGVQGAPDGQPLWGLTKGQFASLYESMIAPVDFETKDKLLAELHAKWPLPPKSPLNWSNEARDFCRKLLSIAGVLASEGERFRRFPVCGSATSGRMRNSPPQRRGRKGSLGLFGFNWHIFRWVQYPIT